MKLVPAGGINSKRQFSMPWARDKFWTNLRRERVIVGTMNNELQGCLVTLGPPEGIVICSLYIIPGGVCSILSAIDARLYCHDIAVANEKTR